MLSKVLFPFLLQLSFPKCCVKGRVRVVFWGPVLCLGCSSLVRLLCMDSFFFLNFCSVP